MNLFASSMLSRAMNVQISSMSACALLVILTSYFVGVLELSQNPTHFAGATCRDVLFANSEQFRQVASLQMLLICFRVDEHCVRFPVNGEITGRPVLCIWLRTRRVFRLNSLIGLMSSVRLIGMFTKTPRLS
jgi:hypothetical protein